MDINQPQASAAALPSVGTLFKSSWSLFKLRWPTFLGILLIPTIILIIYTLLLPSTPEPRNAAVIAETVNPAQFLIVSILMIVAFWWATVALLVAVTKSDSGLGIGDSFKQAVPFLIPYLWVSILVGVITTIGFILLIIPGIIFTLWLLFSNYILIDQNIRGGDALKTSKAYMKGNMGAVFWRALAGVVIIYLPVIILSAIIGAAVPKTAAAVVSNIISLVAAPLLTIYIFRLYLAVKAKAGSQPQPSASPAQPV